MLIDVNKYVDIIMTKLENASYYSEISRAELLVVITKKLSAIYDDKITALSLKFDMERDKGLPLDSGTYREEYDRIRREILEESYQIALTTKPELPELPEY